MGRVAGLLRFLEVAVLGLDDVVGAIPAVLEVAGPAQVPAGHDLHVGSFLVWCLDLACCLDHVRGCGCADDGDGPGQPRGVPRSRRATRESTSGAARKVMACTRPSSTVKSKTTLAAPRWNQALAGRSPTKTGSADWALPLKKVATAWRPSICRGVPTRTAASSAVTTASGARSRNNRSKSPFLAAAMKASTTSQSARWSSGWGWVTLARAREASLRAAAGVVSR